MCYFAARPLGDDDKINACAEDMVEYWLGLAVGVRTLSRPTRAKRHSS